MSLVNLDTALRIPAPDVEALIQGRLIAALPRMFIDPGRVFALYPADPSTNPLPTEQYYRSNFLPIAKSVISQLHPEAVVIKAGARCELCQVLDQSEPLENLSQLTIWTTEALQQILSQRPYIFLAYLRVYLLPEPLVMSANAQGQFVALSRSLNVTKSSPVLSDRIFAQRRHQLENREPPPHPELEELQSAIAQLLTENLTAKEIAAAKQLDEKIEIFLGWSRDKSVKQLAPDLAWINDIAALGDRSIELEEKKSNYQAGTDFENVVRRSLEFIGFTVDEAYKGGAGGLDLFCSKPYPLIVECKAGKSIPGHSVYELDKLGDIHLDSENLATVVKLIIGPGKATSQLQTVAQKRNITIINPMTLQKLVELQANYPKSVNLVELKAYLEAGQIDYRIEEYVQKVLRDIKLRSQIIKAVQQLCRPGKDSPSVVAICTQYNAKFVENHSDELDEKSVRDLLIELSSPLTGYLGRTKGNDGSDRFYFLRDLSID